MKKTEIKTLREAQYRYELELVRYTYVNAPRGSWAERAEWERTDIEFNRRLTGCFMACHLLMTVLYALSRVQAC